MKWSLQQSNLQKAFYSTLTLAGESTALKRSMKRAGKEQLILKEQLRAA